MSELRGKGWRVLGYFIWMIGAGIILDSTAVRTGLGVLGVGAAMFLAGVWQSWRERPTGERDGEEPRRTDRA